VILAELLSMCSQCQNSVDKSYWIVSTEVKRYIAVQRQGFIGVDMMVYFLCYICNCD